MSLADKLHNARSILRDHRADPDGIWGRFSVEKEDTLWYYRGLVQAYRAAGANGYLIDELERVVRKLVARDGGGKRWAERRMILVFRAPRRAASACPQR